MSGDQAGYEALATFLNFTIKYVAVKAINELNKLVVQDREKLFDYHKDLLYTPKDDQVIKLYPGETFSWFNMLQLVVFLHF